MESGPAPKPKASGRETPTAQAAQLRSWDRQLDAYAKPQGGSPSGLRTLRARLVEAVKAAPESPEAWWALLQQEESLAANATATLSDRGARGGVTLLDLFLAATKVVPRHSNYSNEAFIKIWLGFARQQWVRNHDDARDVFKMLKSQHIGERHAGMYYEWAALEAAGGSQFKALGVLAKGLKEQAQPASLLEQMQADLQGGKFVYKAPWGPQHLEQGGGGGGGSRTAHSLGAFLTPGVLEGERRSNATPTVDCMSGAGGGGLNGATETLVLNRGGGGGAAAAGIRLAGGGGSLPPRPADSGKATAAGGDTDTVVLGAGRAAASMAAAAAAAPATSQQQQQQQHTAGLTDQLGNRTSHSMHSGSTVGSDDPTATMRMKTPATGLSNRTGSSTGSLGEEATVCLRKPGGGGGGEGKPGGDGAGASEDTLVINRGSLLKSALTSGAATTPGAGAAAAAAAAPMASMAGGASKEQGLLKPRRLGVLGKAQRVMPGSAGRPPLPPSAAPAEQAADEEEAAAAAAAAAAEANRKRKAEMEAAQSPKPLLSVGEGKRRQSPGEDVKMGRPALSELAGAAARPADRQLPPVPRFAEQRATTPAAAPVAATRTAAADVVTTAAPGRPPVAAAAPPSSRVPAPSAAAGGRPPAPAGRQQVVLQEDGAAARRSSGRVSGERQEEDETAPVVMSKLAQRVQRGRQSLAPHKVVLGGDWSLLHRSGSDEGEGTPGAADGDDAPTMPVNRPAGQPAAAAAAADEDADATRPLVRAPAARAASPPPAAAARPAGPRVQIDGAGNVNLMRPSSAGSKPLPVPPAPPPLMPEAAAAAAAPAPQAAPRVPMGPPPPKQARPAGTAAGQQQQQQQAGGARPGRRVVEDENTVTVKDIAYTKLECVGRGGSSKVYKVMAPNRKIFALKRIRLTGRDAEAASGFLDEISLLNSLAGHSNIIQLIDSEVHRSEGLIYMVLEFGDIDLAHLLQKHEKLRREKAGGQVEEIDENFIRLYWEQMLQAVDTIHRERIVHSDLKPANFLVVEGQLKLIDFGIAKAIQSDTTSIARESQVGTLNYMSPEAILGGQNNIRGGPPMKVGRASDIWSLGCILYQMVYGHTPFSHLPFIQKMHAIIDTNHRIAFPPLPNAALLDAIQRCLDRNPRTRIGMQELLEHPFLRPTHAAAAAAASAAASRGSSVELSREQLTKLLQQVAAAGVSGGEVGHLSDQLFKQLASGLSPDLISRKVAAAAEARAAAPAPKAAAQQQAQPQQQRQQPASVADAAAQAAAARSSQRADAVAALENRPRASAAASSSVAGAAPAAGGSGRAALMPISQSAIAQQAAALRKVEPVQKQAAARQPESGLEAALRKGLERFKFEDSAPAAEDGNTTGGFSDI